MHFLTLSTASDFFQELKEIIIISSVCTGYICLIVFLKEMSIEFYYIFFSFNNFFLIQVTKCLYMVLVLVNYNMA